MTQTYAENDEPIRIAIYDMDKTITRRPTYTPFLMHMAWRRAPWRLLLLPGLFVGLAAYGLRLWDRARLKTFNQQLFLGKPHHVHPGLNRQIEAFADKVLAHNVHADALAQIAADRAAGYRLVLATASYALYVAPIARRLGFDDVVATNLRLGGGGEWLAEIIEGNCYGETKLTLIEKWMAREGLACSRAECAHLHIRAYSDHISDVPMLALADEAFAVNPHGPLRAEAGRRGWTVLDWS